MRSARRRVYLGAGLHKLEHAMRTKFLGARLWACRHKSDDRQARASSYFPYLSLSANGILHPNLARQKSSKPSKKGDPVLNYRHLISLNEEGNFRFTATGARTRCTRKQKLIQISWSIQSHPGSTGLLFFYRRHRLIDSRTVSKFSGALFLQRRDE